MAIAQTFSTIAKALRNSGIKQAASKALFGIPKTVVNETGDTVKKLSRLEKRREALKAAPGAYYNPLISAKTGRISKVRGVGLPALGLGAWAAYNSMTSNGTTGGLTQEELQRLNTMQLQAAQEEANAKLKAQFFPSKESYSQMQNALEQLYAAQKPYNVGGGGVPNTGNIINAYDAIYGGGDTTAGGGMLPVSGEVAANTALTRQLGASAQEQQNAMRGAGANPQAVSNAMNEETKNRLKLLLFAQQMQDYKQGMQNWQDYLLNTAKSTGTNPYMATDQFTGNEVGLADVYKKYLSLSPVEIQQLSDLGINTPYEYYTYLAQQNPAQYGG